MCGIVLDGLFCEAEDIVVKERLDRLIFRFLFFVNSIDKFTKMV